MIPWHRNDPGYTAYWGDGGEYSEDPDLECDLWWEPWPMREWDWSDWLDEAVDT